MLYVIVITYIVTQKEAVKITTNKLSFILYVVAALLILIPISIVLVTEITFSSYFSKVTISTALACIIVGRILTLIKKDRKDKTLPIDIGIVMGLLIVLVSRLLK